MRESRIKHLHASRERNLVLFGGFLSTSILIFLTIIIFVAHNSGGAVRLPLLGGTAETATAIVFSVISLSLFPDLWRSIDTALARHYCRCSFLGTSWRVRRITIAFGTGCIITASLVVLSAYLLGLLSPTGWVWFNVNAFGEAIPELLMFAGLGVPAAVYACANAAGVQDERLITFRWLFHHPRSGTYREWYFAAKSLFRDSEWKLILEGALSEKRGGEHLPKITTS